MQPIPSPGVGEDSVFESISRLRSASGEKSWEIFAKSAPKVRGLNSSLVDIGLNFILNPFFIGKLSINNSGKHNMANMALMAICGQSLTLDFFFVYYNNSLIDFQNISQNLHVPF